MSDWFANYGYAEVFPELVIGAYPLDADDVAALADEGVRRVLNLANDDEYQEGQRAAVERALAEHGIEEIRMSIVDFGHLPADRLDEAVRTVVGWMDDCEPTYVHCRAGWQRSASVAAGAVAVFNDVDIATALQWVRRHKPTADPLPHQRADLVDWWLTRGRREAAEHAGAGSSAEASTAVADDDVPASPPAGDRAAAATDDAGQNGTAANGDRGAERSSTT
jgi:predicted protein tyrosine phosphatase